MQQPILTPNIQEAAVFVETITQGDESKIVWLCLDEKGTGRPPIQIYDTLENAFFRLSKANREGYGVFATINKSSNGGRKAEDICEVRAIFIDIDNDVDNASQRLAEFQLQPHLEICTSPGRLHAYWVVADCSLDDFRAAQIKLSLYFNGDPAICDLPRVMRVPGFYHQKKEPFLSLIMESFPQIPAYQTSAILRYATNLIAPAIEKPILKIEDFSPQPGERNKEFFRLACKLQRNGHSMSEKLAILHEKNSALPHPLSTDEIEQIVISSDKYPPDTSVKTLTAKFKERKPASGPLEGKKRRPAALTEQYFAEFAKYFGEVRRDIFSGLLLFKNKEEDLWQPCDNKLKPLRHHLRMISENELAPRFEISAVEDHLAGWAEHFPLRLCVDVPEWDGQDRIKELCDRVTLDAEIGIDQNSFTNLVKDWHAKMWGRFHNPQVQNRLIILLGVQDAGKDFWIDENIGALGQFSTNFHVEQNSKDTRLQLHAGLVLKISEFDRTSKMEVSTLKDIITCDHTMIRAPFAKAAQVRKARCSMISSCNVDDILTDHTGNRRFVIFHVMSIDKSTRFSEKDRMQVLAQGQALYKQGYKSDELSESIMKQYLSARTPEAPSDEIVYMFDAYCTKESQKMDHEWNKARDYQTEEYDGLLLNHFDISDRVFEYLRKRTGKTDRQLRRYLSWRKARTPNARGYYYKKIEIN